jgi:NTE family protein
MRGDLILSSGYLAFSRQLGFLDAWSAVGGTADALVGTSSGALIGALWAAGHTPDAIAAWIPKRPLALVRPSWPWRGLFRLDGLRRLLNDKLPATFEELSIPLGVGVVDVTDRTHLLATSGDLRDAVLASCAVPWLFEPVTWEGRPRMDGGVLDRTAVSAWRAWRPSRQAVLHRLERTAGRDQPDDLSSVRLVVAPRARASLWTMGDLAGERAEHRAHCIQRLQEEP